MNIIKYPQKKYWPELLARPVLDIRALDKVVGEVLRDVRENGDEALFRYTERFDNVRLESFTVTEAEKSASSRWVNKEFKEAVRLAVENIEKFHQAQIPAIVEVETMPGVKCWQKAIPVEKVGLYVPGGTAPLFSTVLMLALPARIAGCREIILCSPPDKDGSLNPAIVYAAGISGISKIFKLGGAQAIAAMAYGTETVSAVNKIFGPGNQYVTAAKQLVSRDRVAIDLPAGPSEVAVLADGTSNPEFIASDLLSQAEHGANSQVLLISTSEQLINQVEKELSGQLNDLPRKEFAEKSLANSKAILVKDYDTMMELVNEYAPEHLIISVTHAEQLAEQVINAGSVFIGEYTPESAGDYASGTNHTLPTNGYAKAYSGVNMDAYYKKISFQKISQEGLKIIGPAIERMALTEQLTAHQRAVSLRLKTKN